MDINPEDVAFLEHFQTLPKLRRQALYAMSPPS